MINNIKTYDEFINEEFLGFSKYRGIVNKIHRYILDMDVNNITDTYGILRFIIEKEKKIREDDPYGEEIWEGEGDIRIKLEKNGEKYKLYVNDQIAVVTNYEAKKLYLDVKNKFKNKNRDQYRRDILNYFNVPYNKIYGAIINGLKNVTEVTYDYDCYIADIELTPENFHRIQVEKNRVYARYTREDGQIQNYILKFSKRATRYLFNKFERKYKIQKRKEKKERIKQKEENIFKAFKDIK